MVAGLSEPFDLCKVALQHRLIGVPAVRALAFEKHRAPRRHKTWEPGGVAPRVAQYTQTEHQVELRDARLLFDLVPMFGQ